VSKEVKSYRDLIAWQKSIELAGLAYQIATRLPKLEVYEMGSQIRRAAVSIPSNIAEGHARKYTREYLHFLAIAKGSLAELQTLLEITVRFGYGRALDIAPVLAMSEQVEKILAGLTNSLNPNP
jgi:four helix bundle protein